MKKSILLIIGGLIFMTQCCGTIVNAQTEKKYTVPENMLTEQQKSQLDAMNKTAEVNAQIQTVSKYAGLGNEIGEATKGALEAVKDNSIELAESDLGKFVMMLVAWKVLWIHVLRMAISVFIFLISTVLFAASYFKTLGKDEESYGVTIATSASVHWAFWILTLIACGIIGFA